MIRYKAGIMQKLSDAGYSSHRIRMEKIFGQKTMQDFRSQAQIPYKSIETLCKLLKCDITDVIEYIPEDEPENES